MHEINVYFCIFAEIINVMANKKCEECGKSVKQTPGKREKRFCDSTCRSNNFQKARTAAKNTPKKKMKPLVFKKPTKKVTVKEKLESKVVYTPAGKESYDAPKLTAVTMDEPGQFAKPKSKTPAVNAFLENRRKNKLGIK